MAEQLKLLRRPLFPKLPCKPSTPREKVGQAGKGFGQYLTRTMKNINDKNGKAVSSSYDSARGQVKQTDASLGHGQISQSLVPVQPKDTFLTVHRICQGRTQVRLKDLQTQFLPGSIQPQFDHMSSRLVRFQRRRICQLNQGGNRGRTRIQSKTTGFRDQRRRLIPPETSFHTQVKQKGDVVLQNNDPACWPFPGITANVDNKYKISPVYSGSQMLKQSKEKNMFSVQTPRSDFILTKSPSGADNFVFCKNHKFSHVKHQELKSTGRVHSTPIFTLESLAEGSSPHRLPVKTTLKKPFVSRYNYNVLSSRLMTENKSLRTEVNTVILSDIDLPGDETGRTEQQKFLGTALQEKSRKSGSPEKLLQEEKEEKGYIVHYVRLTEPDREEGPFTDANDAPDGNGVEDIWETNFHFMASKKDEEEKLMFRSQVKVWHCHLNQKTALSLQAYFLFHLPDLTPVTDTLVCLNLSFNNLLFFPVEVLNIKSLQVLVLRSNPIREIPNDIHRLKLLKKFTISFNLLSELPPGLFLLEDLFYLDIAYNYISFIPGDIKNLRKLESLNTEGNQLSALPSGVLNLPLQFLRIENNFMHPLIWNEKIQNQPQKLTHLAALCFSRNGLNGRYPDLTEDIKKILDDFTACDCCGGPRYGKGLQLVQIYRNIFKFGRLPFYFYACSPSCRRNFLSQTEA